VAGRSDRGRALCSVLILIDEDKAASGVVLVLAYATPA
jgi:hypothetical protein